MKAILVSFLFFAGSSFAAPRVVQTIGDKPDFIPYIEEVPTSNDMERSVMDYRADAGDENAVSVGDIINLGQKLWSIIEKNKAVQDVKYNYANALPRGATTADLDSFSDLQAKSYRIYGKNFFGVTVFDVTYTLIHRYDGNYNGVGRYLDNVTVLPQKVSTSWGYKTNLSVSSVSTVNVGSKAAPIASLSMELNFKVSTIMKVTEMHNIYGFRGDSSSVQAIQ